jgi:hypothetical protein
VSYILRGSIIGAITGGLLACLGGAFAGTVFEVVVSAAGFGAPLRTKTICVAALIGLCVGAPLGAAVGGLCGGFLRGLLGLAAGASAGLLTLALCGAFLGWALRGPGEPLDWVFAFKLMAAGGAVGGLAGTGLGAVLEYGLERLGPGAP